MALTRRAFLQSTGAGLGFAGLGPTAVLSSVQLGDISVQTISDGNLVLPGDFIFGPMPQDELLPLLGELGQPADRLEPECNVTLVRDAERVILFDVGSGQNFVPSAGKMLDTLEMAGLGVDDVTHVVFTHAHPDHIWGLLDDFDDPMFPSASHLIGRAEWDYWINPETVNTIDEERVSFAVGTKRRLEVVEDAIEFFDDGQEILPGIAARASYGHTPGHMAFEVRSGQNGAMIVGDAIGNHHVAFARPDWPSGSDQDQETAIKSRLALLDQIETEKMTLVGFHLPNGGIGHVEKHENAYRFVGAEK